VTGQVKVRRDVSAVSFLRRKTMILELWPFSRHRAEAQKRLGYIHPAARSNA
jgi:hypothetical protein